VNVVEERSPSIIIAAVRACKANDAALFLRDDNELIRGRL